MTIFNVTGGSSGGGGDGSPTFKEMTTNLYQIKESDWGTHYTQIPNYFFYRQELLEKIELPQNITKYGDFAFSYCISLNEITIPQGVTTIGTNAFEYCESLTEIVIPQGVTKINNRTFLNCTSLAEITIPQSVTQIDGYAFNRVSVSTQNGCTLTMLRSRPPTLASTSFTSTNINKIIVPQGSLTAYQTATNWSAYASYMEEAQ